MSCHENTFITFHLASTFAATKPQQQQQQRLNKTSHYKSNLFFFPGKNGRWNCDCVVSDRRWNKLLWLTFRRRTFTLQNLRLPDAQSHLRRRPLSRRFSTPWRRSYFRLCILLVLEQGIYQLECIYIHIYMCVVSLYFLLNRVAITLSL